MDLQTSYEINGNFKTGLRYRKKRDNGDYYEWEYDTGSDITGKYLEDELWNHEKAGDLIRGYSKIRVWQIGNLDLGMLLFLQHDARAANILSKKIKGDPIAEAREREFIIETNPFLNYQIKGGYIDFGMLVEYSRTGINNISDRWNPVSHSDQKEVLWDTSPYIGWSQPWENYSKGSQWFFATGFESYASVGISKKISMILRLLTMKKYTYIDKFYGTSEIPAGGSAYEFVQSHKRDTYKNETWMTGTFGINWILGSFDIYALLDLPLGYLLKQQTQLRDNNSLLFDHTIRNVWQVQQPASFRIFMVYTLYPKK